MIQGKVSRLDFTALAPDTRAIDAARTVLVIDAPESLRILTPRPDRQTVVLTQRRMLCQSMLSTVRPDAIIGPLIASDWDIVDLGMDLESMGFRGDLYALTRPLPRAELVAREVGAVCPGLNVRLLELA